MNNIFIPEIFYKNELNKIYNEEFIKNYLVQGYYKKKAKTLLNWKQKRYFKFSNKGKILVYYDEKPKIKTKIKGLYKIENIINTEIKKEKIIINLNGKSIELKSIKKNDINNLKKSIDYFKNLYFKENIKNKNIFKKSDYDFNELFNICYENEIEQKDLIFNKLDYTDFLNDKKLENLIEEIPIDILKKRMFLGKVNFAYDNKFSNNFWNLKETKIYVMFMISPIIIRDYINDENDYDNEILTKENIGNDIDFNHIYFYKYEGKGDISHYEEKININDIEDIKIKDYWDSSNFSYNFEIKNSDLLFDISTKYAYEAILWIDLIKKYQENNMKNNISRFGGIKINSDNILSIYKNNIENFEKKVESEYANICSNYKSIKKLIPQLYSGIKCLNSRMDSIYCIKPFNINFYKAYLSISYKKLLSFIIYIWENKNSDLKTNQISEILQVIITLEKWLNFWYGYDNRIKNSLKNIILLYISQIYETSIKLIQNFMEKLDENSDVVQIFNSFISEIFYNYEKMKNKKLLKSIIYLINKLIIYFQNELTFYLGKNKKNNKYLINISNSIIKFIIKQKEFIEFIKNQSNYTEYKIKILLNENKLICNYVEIGNECINLLTNNLKDLIENEFKNINNIINFKIEIFFKNLENFISLYIKKLNKVNQEKSFKILIENFNLFYLNLFVNTLKNNKKIKKYELINKIKEDYKFINNFYLNINFRNTLLEVELLKLNTLIEFLENKNTTKLIILIININLFSENKLKANDIKYILDFRSDLGKSKIKYILEHFERIKPNKIIKAEVINTMKINLIVLRFILKLKLKLKKKNIKLHNIESIYPIKEDNNDNIDLDINDYIFLKKIKTEKIFDNNTLNHFFKKIEYEKLFLTFNQDSVNIYRNNSKKNLMYDFKFKECSYLHFNNDLIIYIKINDNYFEITNKNKKIINIIYINFKYLKSKFDNDIQINKFSIIDQNFEKDIIFKKFQKSNKNIESLLKLDK